MNLGTWAIRACNVCGRTKMMPARSKRCYDCKTMGYTKRNNPHRKKSDYKGGGQE